MPAEEKFPWFPFYVLDFEGDDKVAAMEPPAVAAHVHLMCKAWHQQPPGTLPNDDKTLSMWARLSMDQWNLHKNTILSAYAFASEDGRWHQKRLESEYAKLMESIRKKKKSAKDAADVRWGKIEKSYQKQGKEQNASAMRSHSGRNADSCQSESESELTTTPPLPPSGGREEKILKEPEPTANAAPLPERNAGTPLPPGSLLNSDKPPPKPRKSHDNALRLDGFEEFISKYPKGRVDVKNAMRAWDKHHCYEPERTVKIMRGLAAQIADKKRKIAAKQWIEEWPNPATWVNRERWNDQVGETLDDKLVQDSERRRQEARRNEDKKKRALDWVKAGLCGYCGATMKTDVATLNGQTVTGRSCTKCERHQVDFDAILKGIVS